MIAFSVLAKCSLTTRRVSSLAIGLLALAAVGAAPFPPAAAAAAAIPAGTAMAVAAIALVAVTVLVARGNDVRLVLMLGAVPLFLAVDRLPAMLHTISDEMTKKGTVIPICSAMGFAFVLRFTGCDEHLVRLLTRPLRRLHALLVPGGILAGYLINTTIVSQAGTAAVLGPVLIPLLRAGGIGPARAGAILLLGSSMGGELFNPGAVEIRKLAELSGVSGAGVVSRSAQLNLLACSTTAAAFWLLARRRAASLPRVEPNTSPESVAPPPDGDGTVREEELSDSIPFQVNLVKAMVPTLPLLILAADTIIGSNAVTRPIEGPTKILAAMLIGVLAAGATRIQEAGGLSTAFFDGAGYAYTHVISLIVAASTFAEGIRISGLIGPVIRALMPWPSAAMAAATIVPWGLAIVCGSGIAPAVAIMEFFVPAANVLGIDPIRLGALTAMGAHFGRTMSPAAAVVVMSARLSGAKSSQLIGEVAIPLLAGGLALVTAALMGVV